jgi:hypothetical protein
VIFSDTTLISEEKPNRKIKEGISMTKEDFFGTWKLISSEFRSSNGQVTYPFGQNAIGLLMYDAAGYMSVQLMRADRPIFKSGDVSKGTPAELKTAFEGLITYFGIYEINEKEGTITHQIKNSSFPNFAGTSQTRFFQFSDNRLTLRTPPTVWGGKEITGVLTWERVAKN